MTTRAIETRPASPRESRTDELRPTNVGGKVEMLPSDPQAVAKILIARRAKMSSAAKLKATLLGAMRKRGILV